MKKIYLLLVVLAFTLLSSCSGSDTYQGKWKAMNAKGEKFDIIFSPDTLTVKENTGKTFKFSYSQNSIKTDNGKETYGIILEDGRGLHVFFPMEDESIGMINDENSQPVFTISRKKYITYEEIYKLN